MNLIYILVTQTVTLISRFASAVRVIYHQTLPKSCWVFDEDPINVQQNALKPCVVLPLTREYVYGWGTHSEDVHANSLAT